MSDFIIIGGGVYGASTAVHLKRHFPGAKVTLLERSPASTTRLPSPAPDAASSDLNKIIRADYANDAFRRLAVEAIAEWRADARLKPFYHEVGLLLHSLPYGSAQEPGLVAAQKAAERGVQEAALVAQDEAAGGTFASSKPIAFLCDTADKVHRAIPSPARQVIGPTLAAIGGHGATAAAYFNPRAGWAEAKEATSAMLQQAIDLGVQVEFGAAVVDLVLEEEEVSAQGAQEEPLRRTRGVKTVDGRTFELATPRQGAVFLCGGSWTPQLLDSLLKPAGIKQLPSPPVVFSAQTVLIVRIPADVARRHAEVPVVLNYDTGFYCFEPRKVEAPGGDGPFYLVKCAIHDRGYQSPAPPGPSTSAGPTSYPGFDAGLCANEDAGVACASTSARVRIPPEHEARMLQALKAVWPEMAEQGVVHESRICWYAETTDENWLIDNHPVLSNLVVASGDSGHGFKFLPTIGKLIVARLPAALRASAAVPIPPLNPHWDRVFSWAHHAACFEALHVKRASGGARVQHIEWKPDRDSASQISSYKGEGSDQPALPGHDASRGL